VATEAQTDQAHRHDCHIADRFRVGEEARVLRNSLYVQKTDAETWEHITPAIDVMMTPHPRQGVDGGKIGHDRLSYVRLGVVLLDCRTWAPRSRQGLTDSSSA
jgi:hypothetical protein